MWLHDHGKKYGEMDYWQAILLNDVYCLENTSQYNGNMEESYSWEWCVRNAKCFNGTRYQKHGLCHKVEGSGMSSYLMSCTMTATCTDSWLCAHDHPTLALVLATTVTHWIWNNTESSYLQHMGRDLWEGWQWLILMDSIPTGMSPPFTHIPVPYHVSCHSCI